MSIRLVTKSIWKNSGNRGKRLKKTRDAVLWQIHKRIIKSPRTLRLANGVVFKAYPDCVVSSALIYADWPEYHELMFLRSRLAANEVVIDVGANVGHISLLLADVVGPTNIVAFEPTPISFARLNENWEINGWPIHGLMRAAVGKEAGTVFINNVQRPVTTNAISATATRENAAKVPLVRLDDFQHLWSDRSIGLLKIDVEGYEEQVFLGSRKLLQKFRPRFLMFESLAGTLEKEIECTLRACDYLVFQLDSGGCPDFTCCSAQNLFAIPKEQRTRLQKR